MNFWLSIALVAYFIGALVEGIHAATQLSHLTVESSKDSQDLSSTPNESSNHGWHLFTAVASVSICGAMFWPCRLIHRSMKDQSST